MNELLLPVWEEYTAFDESFLPIEGRDGGMPCLRPLYNPDRILSVRSADHKTEYAEGSDYLLEDGCIVLPENSRIPYMRYAEYYPETAIAQHTFPKIGGGNVAFSEGSFFHERQIVVTYTHIDPWTGRIPLCKAGLLPKTREKLACGKPLHILVFGDSICTGCNSSSFVGAQPYQKTWFAMLRERLAEEYSPSAVTLTNTSVGGTVSKWGELTASENIKTWKPDLCILGFGMNDGSGRVPVDEYIGHMKAMIAAAKQSNPDCECILIATSLPNPEAEGFVGLQKDYLAPLLTLEEKGVCVADMTTLHEDLLSRKAFGDMSGNNINHPNDYLARVYAQLLLRTLGAV